MTEKQTSMPLTELWPLVKELHRHAIPFANLDDEAIAWLERMARNGPTAASLFYGEPRTKEAIERHVRFLRAVISFTRETRAILAEELAEAAQRRGGGS